MRPPIHQPFKDGRGGIEIGLKPIEDRDWLEIDELFNQEIQDKLTLIEERRSEVIVSNKNSLGSQRELLPAGGILSMSITASGVFTDSTAEQTLRSAYGTSTFKSYNVIVPDLGTYAGTFMIASLEYAGEYNGEATYSVTLESSGAVTFSAA